MADCGRTKYALGMTNQARREAPTSLAADGQTCDQHDQERFGGGHSGARCGGGQARGALGADQTRPDLVPVVRAQLPFGNASEPADSDAALGRHLAGLEPVLNMLAKNAIPDRGSEFAGAAVENVDGLLDGGNLGHAGHSLQICLHDRRKLACAQGRQNILHMKTLGQQAKDFRESKKWGARQLAEAVGTSRQNIESLELKGNRVPKYIGKLAIAMNTTTDAMLAQAGLRPKLFSQGVQAENESAIHDPLTEQERALLDDWAAMGDDDQVELAAEISRRAEKMRRYMKKVYKDHAFSDRPYKSAEIPRGNSPTSDYPDRQATRTPAIDAAVAELENGGNNGTGSKTRRASR